MSKSTPWGPSQHQKQAAPGIVFYSTAGHGGFHLSVSRMMEFRQMFPGFQTFAGGPWFEEDCDYCMVVLAFAHDVFNDEQVRDAVRMVLGYSGDYFAEAKQWLESESGAECRQRADAFDKDHAAQWERGGMSSGGFRKEYDHCWCVHLNRNGRSEHKAVMMPDYPSKRWYTDAEVSQFEEFDAAKHYPPRKQPERSLALVGTSCGEYECHSDADPGL